MKPPRTALACLLLVSGSWSASAAAQGWLRAEGTRIVDETDRPVILRGMGLGGWMLQEGYMLGLGDLEKGQQHVIRRHIADLIGEDGAAEFYQAWLDNYITKADIDAMGAWGFNSVRLPMHYNLFTLPVEDEPVAGQDTWLEDGFARVDRLLEWTRANDMHLILDLHAAPGGQGTDLPISDRDPAKPSLWENPENQRKLIALWEKLAQRYADEPGIGAYDILNEPNWDFDGPAGGHGCESTQNAQLWDFYRRAVAAIRAVDQRHMLVIEGNCWGNNYKGLDALPDDNMVVSFHKYWNVNTPETIADFLALRERYDAPLWLGESGENSNTWFRDSIALVEGEGIGWAFWPLKKFRFNQPLQVDPNPGWGRLLDYWLHGGPRPSRDEAYATLMQLARHDIRYENNIRHRGVVDAMLRQPHDHTARAYLPTVIDASGGTIEAVNYDMGRAGVAWSDSDDANYHITTGGERTRWNNGETYRNDGVDIAIVGDARHVSDFKAGEWMQYSFEATAGGRYPLSIRAGAQAPARYSVSVNGGAPVELTLDGSASPVTLNAGTVALLPGRNRVVVRAVAGDGNLHAIHFGPLAY